MSALPGADRWSWQDQAACRNHPDPDLFFGPDDESPERRAQREAAAVDVCRSCLGIAGCLHHALTRPEPHGVWGGMGEDDRARLRRTGLHRSRRPPTLQPGQKRAVGDMRILQGLAVAGIDLDTVQSRTRISAAALANIRSGRRLAWAAANSAKLRAALPDLLDQSPLRVTMVHPWAVAQGWAPLSAWEDQDIDDPTAMPQYKGTTPELVSDADFHTRFTPARRQSKPARRGGSVTNIVHGPVDGVLLQSGGDLHFPNGLHL